MTRLAWIPVPIFSTAIILLCFFDQGRSFENPFALLALNFVFSLGVSLFVTYLLAQAFLARGALGMLLLAAGVLSWGFSGLVGVVAGLTETSRADFANITVTVHNSCVFVSAILQLIGVILLLQSRRPVVSRGFSSAVAYCAILGVVGLIALSALKGWAPTFFIDGKGGTQLRQFVLGSSITMFFITVIIMWNKSRKSSRFLYWYSLSLVLIAVGLLGVMLEPVHGGILSWVGRSAQFSSGPYMLIAAILSIRESHREGAPVEAALTKTQLQLRESEERYRALVQFAPAGIYEVDFPSGRFTQVNDAMCQILGYSCDELLAMNAFDVLADDDKVRFSERIRRAQVGAKLEEAVEYRVRTKGGRLIWALLNTTFRRKDGKFIGATVVAHDITERKNAEEALRQKADELAVANSELKAFSYSISHDLRAPLRAMKGFSSILLKDYSERLDGEGREFLQRIEAGADKMGELIDDMLSLAKISRQKMTPQEIDLSDLADMVVNELCLAEPERKVDIAIAKEMKAIGDARLLRIALSNLFGNAWKYTSKTPAARIEFGAMKQNDETAYYIRDNGAGFDMTQVYRIFEPFQRLHDESQFPGTGVGLAIVNRIVQRHGGRVRAEGETGKGAAFYFTLPCDKGCRN